MFLMENSMKKLIFTKLAWYFYQRFGSQNRAKSGPKTLKIGLKGLNQVGQIENRLRRLKQEFLFLKN